MSVFAQQQFDAVASAYLTSAVHSSGPDPVRIAKMLGKGTEHDLLDVGCGAGHLSFHAAPHVRSVTACDVAPKMLELVGCTARERGLANITTVLGPAENLPFPDASFDWVCTRYSAHHWENLPRALAEIRRVLKSRGRFVAIDVITHEDPLTDTHLQAIELLRDPSHVRDYGLGEWNSHLSRAGFKVSAHRSWKLPMEFQPWIERSRTAPERVAAVHSLLRLAPDQVRRALKVATDGSFELTACMIEARS
jgi:SAM-dependent methyltransferase